MNRSERKDGEPESPTEVDPAGGGDSNRPTSSCKRRFEEMRALRNEGVEALAKPLFHFGTLMTSTSSYYPANASTERRRKRSDEGHQLLLAALLYPAFRRRHAYKCTQTSSTHHTSLCSCALHSSMSCISLSRRACRSTSFSALKAKREKERDGSSFGTTTTCDHGGRGGGLPDLFRTSSRRVNRYG